MSVAAKWVCCIAFMTLNSILSCAVFSRSKSKTGEFIATVNAIVFLLCMFAGPLAFILWIVRL